MGEVEINHEWKWEKKQLYATNNMKVAQNLILFMSRVTFL